MIDVKIFQTPSGEYTGFRMTGHADMLSTVRRYCMCCRFRISDQYDQFHRCIYTEDTFPKMTVDPEKDLLFHLIY